MYSELIKRIENLSDFDRRILDIIFESPLPYLDILFKQLCASTFKRENCITSYFLDFYFDTPVIPIQTSITVPVSIDICPDIELCLFDDKMAEYYKKTGTAHLLESVNSPKIHFIPHNDDFYNGINIHFKNGIIKELEVVNWAGSPIDYRRIISDVGNWKKIFRYNDERWFNIVIDRECLK